jgi:hypothetical protein
LEEFSTSLFPLSTAIYSLYGHVFEFHRYDLEVEGRAVCCPSRSIPSLNYIGVKDLISESPFYLILLFKSTILCLVTNATGSTLC